MSNEKQRKPCIIVFAGPNGSGKSSLTSRVDILPPYINADDIKKETGCSDLEAAQKADAMRLQCVEWGEDFTFETVLSTNKKLEFLKYAKEHGYFIKGFFVLTKDASVNVLRVWERVQSGGHDVPEEKIRSRYEKSLARVQAFVDLCNICHIYDNSGSSTDRIFKKAHGDTYKCRENAFWSKQEICDLVGIKSNNVGELLLSDYEKKLCNSLNSATETEEDVDRNDK